MSVRITLRMLHPVGLCVPDTRKALQEAGLDWKHFVKHGYTGEELFAAFGHDHGTVRRVVAAAEKLEEQANGQQ